MGASYVPGSIEAVGTNLCCPLDRCINLSGFYEDQQKKEDEKNRNFVPGHE